MDSRHGLCAISAIPMSRILGKGSVNTNASIDRIDPNKGYEPGNVQLVCRIVNVMKLDMNMDEFVSMCRKIVENVDAKNTSMAA